MSIRRVVRLSATVYCENFLQIATEGEERLYKVARLQNDTRTWSAEAATCHRLRRRYVLPSEGKNTLQLLSACTTSQLISTCQELIALFVCLSAAACIVAERYEIGQCYVHKSTVWSTFILMLYRPPKATLTPQTEGLFWRPTLGIKIIAKRHH